jgi:hypothetical protein
MKTLKYDFLAQCVSFSIHFLIIIRQTDYLETTQNGGFPELRISL